MPNDGLFDRVGPSPGVPWLLDEFVAIIIGAEMFMLATVRRGSLSAWPAPFPPVRKCKKPE